MFWLGIFCTDILENVNENKEVHLIFCLRILQVQETSAEGCHKRPALEATMVHGSWFMVHLFHTIYITLT